jgi:hypothetical protein
MNLVITLLKKEYRNNLYQHIFAGRKIRNWVYSHMKDKLIEDYFYHLEYCKQLRIAIKILNGNIRESDGRSERN